MVPSFKPTVVQTTTALPTKTWNKNTIIIEAARETLPVQPSKVNINIILTYVQSVIIVFLGFFCGTTSDDDDDSAPASAL